MQEVRGRGWNPLMAKECAPESAQWSLVPKVRRDEHVIRSPCELPTPAHLMGSPSSGIPEFHLGLALFRQVLTSVLPQFCRL